MPVLPTVVQVTRIVIPRIDIVFPGTDPADPPHPIREAFNQWITDRAREWLGKHTELEVQFPSGHVERLGLDAEGAIVNLEALIDAQDSES